MLLFLLPLLTSPVIGEREKRNGVINQTVGFGFYYDYMLYIWICYGLCESTVDFGLATMTVGLVFILMEERECNYIWRPIMLVNISTKKNSCLLNSNGPVKFDRKQII